MRVKSGKMTALILSILLMVSLLSGIILAAPVSSGQVSATITTAKLVIDGFAVDNPRSQFPLLTYNDCMYFPITWNYMQALGLEKSGDFETGLRISTNAQGAQQLIQDQMSDDRPSHVDGSDVVADVRVAPIYVQGQLVEHLGSEWPFLFFRDVTYMPATWEYMVTLMGLEYEYDSTTRTLTLAGHKTEIAAPPSIPVPDGNRVTLADVSRLKNIFDFTSQSAQTPKIGLSAQISVVTFGYANILPAASLVFDYDAIVDGTSRQLLYTLLPNQATASRLQFDGLEVYGRANAQDANRMQLFVRDGNKWTRTSESSDITPELFTAALLTERETTRFTYILESMGLNNMVTVLKDPSNNQNVYRLYQNFTLDESQSGKVALNYSGTLDQLMNDLCGTELNKSRFYSYAVAYLGYNAPALPEEEVATAAQYFGNSVVSLSSVFDAATGRVLQQQIGLDMRASATEQVVSLNMDIVYNYNPVLSWPSVD